MQWFVAFVCVVAPSCGRFDFDPLANGDGGDGNRDSAGGGTGLVQAVAFDAASGNFTIDATHGGLAPVTAGHMVVVVCADPVGSNTCTVTSTPATTWQQVDSGSVQAMYVTCDAPAITSVHLTNPAVNSMATVTEWSGMAQSNCFDVAKLDVNCAAAPTAWSVTTPVVSTARELIVGFGEAGAVDAGWVVQPQYSIAINARGVNGVENMFLAYQLVDQAPRAYQMSGTVATWTNSCYTPMVTFVAQ